MKRRSLFIVLLLSGSIVYGQNPWVKSGTTVRLATTSDFVTVGGISQTFGGNKFEVLSGGVMFRSTLGGMVRFENPNSEEGMAVFTNSTVTAGTPIYRGDVRLNSQGLKMGCSSSSAPSLPGAVPSSNLFTITPLGAFGIGVIPSTATYKLTVNGDTKVQGFLDVQQGGTGPNAVKVWGLTTGSLVDVQSSNATSIVPFNAKTGLFVNRTDGNDVNTSGAEIHGQTLGLKTTAMATLSSANTLGIDVSSLTFDGSSKGINVDAKGSTTTYGVFSKANGLGPTAVGVYGYATTTSAVKSAVYGVHGELAAGLWNQTNCWAGYFNGGVNILGPGFINSVAISSDGKLKKNIEPINNGLSIIKQLKPKTYVFKADEYSFMNLPKEKQYGFIAQELEQILPEAVRASVIKDNKNEDFEYKAVNYIELIPILTNAIQEQQTQIESQQAQIEDLKKMLASSNANTTGGGNTTTDGSAKGYLSQNVPNPFTQSTVISYQLPANTKTAGIGVYDLNGKEIKLFTLGAETTGAVTIDGGSMQPGMYVYTLLVNGMPYETKKMVLTSR